LKKIKVLHLIKSLGRGGAEKLIPETALVHDKSKFEFHCLYFFHQEQNIVDELEKAGISVHLIPSGNLGLFFQVKKVQKFIEQEGFDIIHAHLPWAGILSRFVGKNLTIPIVYTEHNTWDRYNKVSYWGNRLSFKNQDIAIAVSNEVVLSMQLNSIIDPYKRGGRLKVKVIQNGVNTDTFQRIEDTSALKSNLGIPKKSAVIGKVAVFRSQKRLWLWVDIAFEILEHYPDTHFLLVGDGEWRERIEEQIKKSGKEKNFHLVGVQKNVIPYLSLMDIYLSTSEFEGLPIAMLEAMSCQVPVVATRAGGIGEVIQEGVQGHLTGIDDWKELKGFCQELLKNGNTLNHMGQEARKRVVEDFSMKKMVSELEEVYFSVLSEEIISKNFSKDSETSSILKLFS
jgi:glycosyltransferase involved in cell wall biosynthesis